jgi:hypothetical protein
MRARRITTVAALTALTFIGVTGAGTSARAEGDLRVWCIAHERMVAKWRRAEPKCGWTVGGYTCKSKHAAKADAAMK